MTSFQENPYFCKKRNWLQICLAPPPPPIPSVVCVMAKASRCIRLNPGLTPPGSSQNEANEGNVAKYKLLAKHYYSLLMSGVYIFIAPKQFYDRLHILK